MKSPAEIRKYLVWGLPVNVFTIVLCIWYTRNSLFETINSLINFDPSIRITPSAPIGVYLPIMLVVVFVILILGAIPCKTSVLKLAERVGNISVFILIFVVLGCIFIVTPLQYYAMPKLGYIRCNILKDHPTIYFTDWVRNPDWCVRGKSREWVREQARVASAQGL